MRRGQFDGTGASTVIVESRMPSGTAAGQFSAEN